MGQNCGQKFRSAIADQNDYAKLGENGGVPPWTKMVRQNRGPKWWSKARNQSCSTRQWTTMVIQSRGSKSCDKLDQTMRRYKLLIKMLGNTHVTKMVGKSRGPQQCEIQTVD